MRGWTRFHNHEPDKFPTLPAHVHLAAGMAGAILLRTKGFQMMRDVVQRYSGNPIVTPEMIPGANTVFNSSVARFGNGYVGMFRVEKRQGYQSLRVGWSDDGITNWKFDPEEALVPTTEPFKSYEDARYDPRITQIDDTYYICHASENRLGCQISVASTKDFKAFTKIAIASEPTNRN